MKVMAVGGRMTRECRLPGDDGLGGSQMLAISIEKSVGAGGDEANLVEKDGSHGEIDEKE
jgi:hypothetical protein